MILPSYNIIYYVGIIELYINNIIIYYVDLFALCMDCRRPFFGTVRAVTWYRGSVDKLSPPPPRVTDVSRVSAGLSGLWRRLSPAGVLVRPGETGGGFEA